MLAPSPLDEAGRLPYCNKRWFRALLQHAPMCLTVERGVVRLGRLRRSSCADCAGPTLCQFPPVHPAFAVVEMLEVPIEIDLAHPTIGKIGVWFRAGGHRRICVANGYQEQVSTGNKCYVCKGA